MTMPLQGAKMITTEVGGNFKQPRSGIRLPGQGRIRFVGAQQGFLAQVFGDIQAAGIARDVMIDFTVVWHNALFKVPFHSLLPVS